MRIGCGGFTTLCWRAAAWRASPTATTGGGGWVISCGRSKPQTSARRQPDGWRIGANGTSVQAPPAAETDNPNVHALAAPPNTLATQPTEPCGCCFVQALRLRRGTLGRRATTLRRAVGPARTFSTRNRAEATMAD